MNASICLLLLLISVAFVSAQLPPLNQLNKFTFQRAYGCGGSYETSALFLSPADAQSNNPILLFNGACGSQTYFQSALAGDNMALISLIGPAQDYPLAMVSAARAFNYNNTVGQFNIFTEEVNAVGQSTYSDLLSTTSRRVLFAFQTLDDCQDPSSTCSIAYVILSYTEFSITQQSPGFNWTATNH